MKDRADSVDIETLRARFWIKAEERLVDDFERLPQPVYPETLESWLGHPLRVGLTVEEMTRLRGRLDELRGMKRLAMRADGTPRRRVVPPPPPPPSRPPKGSGTARRIK